MRSPGEVSAGKAAQPVSRPPGPAQTAPAAAATAPALASVIVADFPDIFAEFRGKRFSLLWRGGRDGAGDFHNRCDGHANTLTVILDTDDNVFGGFTPVKWESRVWNWNSCRKADKSLTSFIFTLHNPHNVPARRFALKAEKKDEAICCDSEDGPHFCDIQIKDHCNANTSAIWNFSNCYTNDTGLNRRTFFTGSMLFQVKKIEVFEITD
jgi:hypothetical protein